MGRGVSSGGGQSSLGYLFGSDEAPKPSKSSPSNLVIATPENPTAAVAQPAAPQSPAAATSPPTAPQNPTAVEAMPASGIQGNNVNNYHRADGQNCGNFITDRRSTKVHAAPGGGSSLDYLFGGESK